MTYFPCSYQDARQKFRQTANATGATVAPVRISGDFEVDVAQFNIRPAGVQQTRQENGYLTLIVTSGLHGVEAFFGSAVQIAAMEMLREQSKTGANLHDLRIVFVHAINPYGFEHIRRVDESNVDLNRNFPIDAQPYREAPAAYHKLNGFLNPQSPPSSLEPYRMKAAYNILRYGVPSLKEAIVCGQYQYPKGIFYGGSEPSAATKGVMDHCEQWVGKASVIAHIDLHSGLGEFGDYTILIDEQPEAEDYSWYAESFGEEALGGMQNSDQIGYTVSGGMGVWLQRKFNDRKYYFAGAEFGTYGPVRVMGALRAENRAHHYASPESKGYTNAKVELLECFCPASEEWRKRVISSSMHIISSAIGGLQRCVGR